MELIFSVVLTVLLRCCVAETKGTSCHINMKNSSCSVQHLADDSCQERKMFSPHMFNDVSQSLYMNIDFYRNESKLGFNINVTGINDRHGYVMKLVNITKNVIQCYRLNLTSPPAAGEKGNLTVKMFPVTGIEFGVSQAYSLHLTSLITTDSVTTQSNVVYVSPGFSINKEFSSEWVPSVAFINDSLTGSIQVTIEKPPDRFGFKYMMVKLRLNGCDENSQVMGIPLLLSVKQLSTTFDYLNNGTYFISVDPWSNTTGDSQTCKNKDGHHRSCYRKCSGQITLHDIVVFKTTENIISSEISFTSENILDKTLITTSASGVEPEADTPDNDLLVIVLSLVCVIVIAVIAISMFVICNRGSFKRKVTRINGNLKTSDDDERRHTDISNITYDNTSDGNQTDKCNSHDTTRRQDSGMYSDDDEVSPQHNETWRLEQDLYIQELVQGRQLGNFVIDFDEMNDFTPSVCPAITLLEVDLENGDQIMTDINTCKEDISTIKTHNTAKTIADNIIEYDDMSFAPPESCRSEDLDSTIQGEQMEELNRRYMAAITN